MLIKNLLALIALLVLILPRASAEERTGPASNTWIVVRINQDSGRTVYSVDGGEPNALLNLGEIVSALKKKADPANIAVMADRQSSMYDLYSVKSAVDKVAPRSVLRYFVRDASKPSELIELVVLFGGRFEDRHVNNLALGKSESFTLNLGPKELCADNQKLICP